MVVNSIFNTGDDCVNFTAGKGADAEKNPPVKDILIFNNYFYHGHGAVVVGSNTGSWIQDILAEDNIINGTDSGLRCKTAPGNGGGGKNIVFRDSALKNINDGDREAFIFTSNYSDANAVGSFKKSATQPQFMNITVENCTVDICKKSHIFVSSLSDGYHQNINFKNVSFKGTPAASLTYLKDSSFENITFDSTLKNPWTIKNSSGLTFKGTTLQPSN